MFDIHFTMSSCLACWTLETLVVVRVRWCWLEHTAADQVGLAVRVRTRTGFTVPWSSPGAGRRRNQGYTGHTGLPSCCAGSSENNSHLSIEWCTLTHFYQVISELNTCLVKTAPVGVIPKWWSTAHQHL